MKYVTIFGLIVACAVPPPSPNEVGLPCTPSCTTGLTCVILSAEESGLGCVQQGMVCSVACGADSDCTSEFGSGFYCKTNGCGSDDNLCARTP
jgi:hypothetical protein